MRRRSLLVLFAAGTVFLVHAANSNRPRVFRSVSASEFVKPHERTDGYVRFAFKTQVTEPKQSNRVGDNIAPSLYDLILAAENGTPRAQLVELWRAFATLNPAEKEMVSRYGRLLAEDQVRGGASTPDLAALGPVARSRELVYQLRDLSAFTGYRIASQLVEIGWAAIPVLVANVHDDRPTRLSGNSLFVDIVTPRSTELMTIGQACGCILDEILGPVNRDQIMAVWGRGPEAHYRPLLKSGDAWLAARAAAHLIRSDRDEYLPAVLERIAETSDDDRVLFLDSVGDAIVRVRPDHVEGWMRARSAAVRCAAASLLLTNRRDEFLDDVLQYLNHSSDDERAGFLSRSGSVLVRVRPDVVEGWLPTASDGLLLIASSVLWEERSSIVAVPEILRRLRSGGCDEWGVAMMAHLTQIRHWDAPTAWKRE